MEFSEIINKHYQSAVELRRELHRFPELSREEKETTRRIRDFLVSKGFSTEEVELNGAKVQVSQPLETGLVVRIKRGEGDQWWPSERISTPYLCMKRRGLALRRRTPAECTPAGTMVTRRF